MLARWRSSGDTLRSKIRYHGFRPCPPLKPDVQFGFYQVGEGEVRTLLRILLSGSAPRYAILSAFVLCGLYFASWYIISHCLIPGAITF
jgi:hypothetical protein